MVLNVNWSALKRYANPQAVEDFDRFLDAMPVNVGYNALIAGGIAWLLAGGAVLFATTETEKVSKLHSSLMEVQALQPPVPVLKYIPVDQEVLKALVTKISATYKGVVMVTSGSGSVTLTAQDTDYFPQFLSAISYLQRGGKNWKVKINTLCVGRDCVGSKLNAALQVELVKFGEPEAKKEGKTEEHKK